MHRIAQMRHHRVPPVEHHLRQLARQQLGHHALGRSPPHVAVTEAAGRPEARPQTVSSTSAAAVAARGSAGLRSPASESGTRSRVTTTVCSKCADRLPSRVTAVHPSPSTFTAGLPKFTIGSIASTMPSASRGPRPADAVVRNLRLLVELRADPVADELAHHRKPVRLDVRLHRRADVRHPRAGAHRLESLVERRFGHRRAAAPRPATIAPTGTVTAAVPVEPVEPRAHVDRHDVAFDQRPLRRNPVHHLLVHRRANRRRVAVIPLERRLARPPPPDVVPPARRARRRDPRLRPSPSAPPAPAPPAR